MFSELDFTTCRDGAHWGVIGIGRGALGGLDPDTIVDNGDGTMTAVTGNMGLLAPLELYLAGLIEADQVPPIVQPLDVDCDSVVTERDPEKFQFFQTFKATGLRTVTMAEVQAALGGARIPGVAESQKDFRAALVVVSEVLLTPEELSPFEEYAIRYSSADDGDDVWYTFAESTRGLATIDFSIVTPRQDQTITFEVLANRLLGQSPFDVTASATSGLPLTFTSNTPDVCTINGNSVTLIATGTCTLVARQLGSVEYNSASKVERTFTVTDASKQDQTITFEVLANRLLSQSPFDVTASATSGLPLTFTSNTPDVCTIHGNSVTLIVVGVSTLVAQQPGNEEYNGATNVEVSFSVTDASARGNYIYLPFVQG